jgi:hypothetical protein
VVRRTRTTKKLLVASIGVATVSYVALSCGGNEVVANLVAQAADTGPGDAPSDRKPLDEFPVANLVAFLPDSAADAAGDVAPQGPDDSSADAPQDVKLDRLTIDEFPVANLVARPDR